MAQFRPGDRVNKKEGYPFPGYVLAVFNKDDGTECMVVEMVDYRDSPCGLLHIFRPDQFELVHREEFAP